MADFTTKEFDIVNGYSEGDGYSAPANFIPSIGIIMFEAFTGPQLIQTYFLMRWLDVDCLPTITYRTWVVIAAPDPTGLQYGGVKCGVTAITGAIVAATWQAAT